MISRVGKIDLEPPNMALEVFVPQKTWHMWL